jgi:hypothetical protein
MSPPQLFEPVAAYHPESKSKNREAQRTIPYFQTKLPLVISESVRL